MHKCLAWFHFQGFFQGVFQAYLVLLGNVTTSVLRWFTFFFFFFGQRHLSIFSHSCLLLCFEYRHFILPPPSLPAKSKCKNRFGFYILLSYLFRKPDRQTSSLSSGVTRGAAEQGGRAGPGLSYDWLQVCVQDSFLQPPPQVSMVSASLWAECSRLMCYGTGIPSVPWSDCLFGPGDHETQRFFEFRDAAGGYKLERHDLIWHNTYWNTIISLRSWHTNSKKLKQKQKQKML